MFKTVKLPFWATVCTLTGIAILCSLGFWQLQRLYWKQDLLLQIDALYDTPSSGTLLDQAMLERAVAEGKDFLRGSIHGHYLPDHAFLTGPRILDEQQGTHFYTPFLMEGGGIVLVNRGWVPAGYGAREQDNHPDRAESSAGEETITLRGLLRKPDKGNMFTPPDQPEDRIFYRIDPDSIAQATGLEAVAAYILYLEEPENGSAASLPRPIAAKPVLNNNHRSYAIFWFTMAGVFLVIYILRFLRPTANHKRP